MKAHIALDDTSDRKAVEVVQEALRFLLTSRENEGEAETGAHPSSRKQVKERTCKNHRALVSCESQCGCVPLAQNWNTLRVGKLHRELKD
mmetsp:Transcript_32915/g.45936  ORF Transcript_32915/g.45936 Transcript_32915/m.45936 type:complete len:90 (-) Transcript_32915:269-538(-)